MLHGDSAYVCMHVCMYVCMYVCTYVCMYVRMYVCMHLQHIFKDQPWPLQEMWWRAIVNLPS